MSGLFNRYYYGNAGKADFTPDQLPTNRVALFFDMLRIRFSNLVGMNLLYVLASVPTLFLSFLTLRVFQMAADPETSALFSDGANLSGTFTMYLLLLIPCMMISSVFSTGVIYVLRNWARDQHTFTMSDFKDTVKANWKGGLLLGFLNGLSLLLVYVAYVYYGAMANEGNLFFLVPQAMVIICGCLWWMANMLITPMMVTYDMKFGTLVRNALIMVVARLPWSMLIWGGSIAIPVVLILFVPYGTLIGGLIYLTIGFSLTFFVYVSYANSCFDRYLNPRIEGAPVNMGLRDPSLVEEEEEVTEEDIKNL